MFAGQSSDLNVLELEPPKFCTLPDGVEVIASKDSRAPNGHVVGHDRQGVVDRLSVNHRSASCNRVRTFVDREMTDP